MGREGLIEIIASKVCDDYSPKCDEYTPHNCENCYVNGCTIGELADEILSKCKDKDMKEDKSNMSIFRCSYLSCRKSALEDICCNFCGKSKCSTRCNNNHRKCGHFVCSSEVDITVRMHPGQELPEVDVKPKKK